MMPLERQVQAAAAPTLERIRDDRERAPDHLRPLLTYITSHLFDSGLDAATLREACDVRDKSVLPMFRKTVGLPPYGYIKDCRMEVACRLLVDTDLKVWQIAEAVGYSTVQVFSRAFERLRGVRPTVYRREQLQETEPTLVEVATLVASVRAPGRSPEAAQVLDALVRRVPELRGAWASAHEASSHGVTVLDLALLRHCMLSELGEVTADHALEIMSRFLRHVPAAVDLCRKLDEIAEEGVSPSEALRGQVRQIFETYFRSLARSMQERVDRGEAGEERPDVFRRLESDGETREDLATEMFLEVVSAMGKES